MGESRIVRIAPLLLLAVVLAVVYGTVWLGEAFYWGLPSLQFVPWRVLAVDALRAGQLPLWNPLNGGGAPLFANYQSGLLYPLHWPTLLMPSQGAIAWAMTATAVLHLFIGGWGMWAFVRRLDLPALAAGVSTLSFALTGYTVARLGSFPTITAAAWLPWLLWAAHRLVSAEAGVRREGVDWRRDTAWLALFGALILTAGHAQAAWYSLLLTGLYTLWRVGRFHRQAWRRLGAALGAVVLGAGVAGLQLFATAELLSNSQRSGGVDAETAFNFSYAPAATMNLLAPNIFGNPGRGTYLPEGLHYEFAIYLGVITLIGAIVGVYGWIARAFFRRKDAAARESYWADVPFWLLVTVVAYGFALGDHSPIFPFLYENVPTFDAFQAPVRWHLWTVIGLSVLGGIGVTNWGRGKWTLFTTRLMTAGAVGGGILAFVVPRFVLDPETASEPGLQVIAASVISAGVLVAVAGLLTLAQPRKPELDEAESWPEDEQPAAALGPKSRWRPLWSVAVLVVLALDLGYAAWGLNPTTSAAFYREMGPTYVGRAFWPTELLETMQFETHLRIDDYRMDTDQLDAYRISKLPNLNLLDGEAQFNNFEPLQIGRYAAYERALNAMAVTEQEIALRRADVTYVGNEEGELERAALVTDSAYLLERPCSADAQEVTRVVIVEDTSRDITNGCLPGGEVIVPDALEISFNHITAEVTATGDQWLFISQVYYPGWQISVDGAAQSERFIAAGVFRAVPLTEGTHTVELVYRPWWLWPGAALSIGSLLVLGVLFRSRRSVLDENS